MKNYNILGDVVLKTDQDGNLRLDSQPMDFLDKECLKHIQQSQIKHALDIGGGAGKHSIRMAQMGANVTLIDRQDPSKNIKIVEDANVVGKNKISLLNKNFEDIDVKGDLKPYDLIYSQRALNYLPYDIFMVLLENLITHLNDHGHFYISVSGFNNEFGRSFPLRDQPLPKRYGLPIPEMQEKHKIKTNTLIFKQSELEEILTGFSMDILRSEESHFGNVKIIAQKK